jgi:hypothetical protein
MHRPARLDGTRYHPWLCNFRRYSKRAQLTMKEPLSIIVSAWSTAFIALFLVYAVAEMPSDPLLAEVRARVVLVFFVGAVTGAGWLWHRHAIKKQRSEAAERTF